MIPEHLKLHNFLSYVDGEVDFTKLDSIILIRGINSESSSDEDNNGCLSGDVLVDTEYGPKEISLLREGDRVWGVDKDFKSRLCAVNKVFKNGVKSVYRNYFGKYGYDDLYVDSTLDHVFLSENLTKKKIMERPIGQFKGDYYGVCRNFGKEYEDLKNEPLAYALGVLLGDGCMREGSLVISSDDESIVAKTAYDLGTYYKKQKGGNYSWTLYGGKKNLLGDYQYLDGLYSGEKKLPDDFIFWNNESVLRLVSGLFDTDGSVYFCEDKWRINFSTTSIDLAYGVENILRDRFGLYESVNINDRGEKGIEYSLVYSCHRSLEILKNNLVLYGPKRECLTKVQAKKDTCSNFTKYRSREYIGEMETYDIHVDNETNLYLLANSMITHNSGKSALLDAVEWCTYGRIRGVFNKDLVKDDIIHIFEDGSRAKLARVTYTFKMDDGFYRIKREKALDGPSCLELHFSEDRKKWLNMTLAAGVNKRTKKKETSIKRTQQKIEDVLNANCDLFINSAFFEQQNTNTFAVSTSGDKSNLLRYALYLDRWSDYAAIKKMNLVDVESEIKSIESQLKGESLEKIEEKIKEYEESLKNCINEKDLAEIVVYEAEKRQLELVKDLTIAETSERTQDTIRLQFKQALSNNGLLQVRQAGNLTKAGRLISAIKKHDEVIKDSKERIGIYELALVGYNKELGSRKIDDTDYSDLIVDMSNEIHGYKGEKRSLSSQKDTFQGDCPIQEASCWRGSEKAHAEKTSKLNRKISGMNKKIAILEIRHKKFKNAHGKQKIELQQLAGLENEILRVGNKITKSTDDIAQHEESLVLDNSEYDGVKKALLEDEAALKESDIMVKDLKKQIDRLKELDIDDIRTNLDACNLTISRSKKTVSHFESEYGRTEEKLSLQKLRIFEIDDLQATFNKLNDRRQVLIYSIKMLSKQIPHQLIEAAIPEIEVYCQEYINRLSLGRMNIELTTRKEIKKKDNVTKENILLDEINMDLECDGVVKKYGLCSGGEKTRADLAIHFAYATFMINRSGAKIRSLFLDEVSCNLDTSGKKALVDLLKRLADKVGFKKIFVISQDERFNKLFDCILTVKKTSEGSQVCLS